MKKNGRFTFVLLLSLFSIAVQAQHIKGTVTDKTTGTALSGVTVEVKGAANSTVTDQNGNFNISVSSAGQTTLTFSYVGYQNQMLFVTPSSKSLLIELDPLINNMEEVVVVGYGSVKKKDLTGSVVSIKGSEAVKVSTTNVMEALQGKVPGADIVLTHGTSNSTASVLLRGHRSLAGGNGPLYIIDGAGGSVNDLNPNDIESIEVLKDASATAIYGSRGANGVILITTKSGKKGTPKISFNINGGINKVSEYPHYMTGPEFVEFRRESFRTPGRWNDISDDPKIFNADELDAIKNNIWTDYRKLLIKTGNQQNYEIGISGGSEQTKGYISIGYTRVKGLFEPDVNNKYTLRTNVDHSINNILKIGVRNQLTYYDQNLSSEPLNLANKISPLGAAFDSTGEIILHPLRGSTSNPLADVIVPNVYSHRINRTAIAAMGYIELTPIKDLSIRSNLSTTLGSSREGEFNGTNSIRRGGSVSRSEYYTSQSVGLLWENVLTYKKEIGDHSLGLTGVTSYQSQKNESSAGTGDGQLLLSQLYYGLPYATDGIVASNAYSQSSLASFTGRLNYSYKGKYLLTLTGRQDGSSKLADGNKWAFFPSGAVAWRLDEEEFIKQVKAIDNLKLRFSYGVTGNDPLGAYSVQTLLTPITFAYDETPAPAFGLSPSVGNSKLKWELSATKNLGIDISLWNGRVSGSLDIYDTRTSNLLLPRTLPSSTGVLTVIQNIGKTRNSGVEILLNTVNIQTKHFTWDSRITFTRNRERIVELVNEGQDNPADGWFIGHPVDVIYDYQKLGIWQLDQENEAAKFGQKPGEIHVKDQDGDGKITPLDRIVLGGGSSVPKWSGGFDNSINYKNWDFNIYVFARIGQLIDASYRSFNSGQQGALQDYWTPENPTNEYPRPNANGNLLYTSTLGYISGSFVKIRTITLGHTLKLHLGNSKSISSFRIYASARNPFSFSRTNQYDPETGGSANFPTTKTFLLGANINF